MAVKSLTLLALFSMISYSQVQAAFNSLGNGVVRIELTKHIQPHVDIEDLEESEAVDEHL